MGSLFFVDTPKTSSYVFIKKNTTNPWKHILNDQVFTKSTTTNFTVEKRMKRKTKQQQTQQQQVHTERMEFGRGLNNWSCPALYRNYRNGRRNTTTNHYYKNTNVIMIVFCCLILFFFDKFRV